ncbi:MAG TPA: 4Fe-4S dicluster domain-containing protein [Clostridiaceae bacterium]
MANMLQLIMSNITHKPQTRLYPITERIPYERSRGQIEMDDTNCIYCKICANKCPADAITVDRDKKIWTLEAHRCIICNECVAVCPKKCITMKSQRRTAGPQNVTVTHVKEVIAKEAAKTE